MRSGLDQLPGAHAFDPEVKCCSYVPRLPTFLVGAILTDPSKSESGRASVAERIARYSGVTPLGLDPPPIFDQTYDLVRREVFGRAPDLRCPHYSVDQSGQCGIWAHRNGTCSTSFCRHVRGRFGRQMWQDIEGLLRSVENQLSLWCCERLGSGPHNLRDLLEYRSRSPADRLALELKGGWGEVYGSLWREWLGRETEFYRSCAEIVAGLSWDDVVTTLGAEVRLRASAARAAMVAVRTTELPGRLARPRPLTVAAADTGSYLMGANPGDPIKVEPALVDRLTAFTSGPTLDLVADLGRDVVGRLVDAGILVADRPATVSPQAERA